MLNLNVGRLSGIRCKKKYLHFVSIIFTSLMLFALVLHSEGTIRYEYFDTPVPWDKAESCCEQHGMTLLMIDSVEEDDYINGLIRKLSTYDGREHAREVWVGMKYKYNIYLHYINAPTVVNNSHEDSETNYFVEDWMMDANFVHNQSFENTSLASPENNSQIEAIATADTSWATFVDLDETLSHEKHVYLFTEEGRNATNMTGLFLAWTPEDFLWVGEHNVSASYHGTWEQRQPRNLHTNKCVSLRYNGTVLRYTLRTTPCSNRKIVVCEKQDQQDHKAQTIRKTCSRNIVFVLTRGVSARGLPEVKYRYESESFRNDTDVILEASIRKMADCAVFCMMDARCDYIVYTDREQGVVTMRCIKMSKSEN